ncbi:hypothetical protein J6590_001425 [Homalodisca vitripennis]|nr:hypothetical protein J6590_001425 [Homalodisca vitripennis]
MYVEVTVRHHAPQILCHKSTETISGGEFSWKNNASDKFKALMKKIILSNGNAFVERGFSINKKILDDNLLQRSFIFQRHLFIVYGGIKTAGGANNINIDKKMIMKCKARSECQEYLTDLRKANVAAADKKETRTKQKRAEIVVEKQQEAEALQLEIEI